VPEKPIAFIFPAFVIEYPEDPFSDLPGFEAYLRSFLIKAATAVDPELKDFHYISRNFLDDELRTQLMTYILCCSYSEFLRDNNIVPSMCAGYSMGIYAAAWQAGSVSFEDGLFLIRQAFLEITRITEGKSYGMSSVLGLTLEDFNQIIRENTGNVEIVNQNSPYSFIFSGSLEEIKNLLDKAQNEGALNIRLLNVTIPYHSKLLTSAQGPFGTFVESITFKDPLIPIVSLIDQSLIKGSRALQKEISRNLYTPLNWYQTQLHLQNSGIRSFVECGHGKTLVKNAKFVEGEIPFYSVNSSIDLLNHPKL
jgi:[acyl-carrier-protein] S-malonyltransferase